jgi:hypothetical protein
VTSYNLFTDTPQLAAAADSDALSVGTAFYTTAPAWVTELRYLSPTPGVSASQCTAALYTTADGLTGTLVAGPITLPAPTDGAWVTGALPSPYALEPGTRYRVVVFHPNGGYVATSRYFLDGEGAADRVHGPVVIPTADNVPYYRQGSYGYGPALQFPTQSFNGASYYSDVTITDVDPSTPPPPPPPSDAVDVTVTGTLDPRRWATDLPARSRTGSLDTKRWAGSL